MADTKDELKQIEAQLQKIATLYVKLGKTNPFAGKDAKQVAKELRGTKTTIFSLATNIKGLNAELVDASSGLKDITKDINEYLAEIGVKGPTAFQAYKKSLKGIKSIASSLEDIQDDLGEATEKQLIGLQKRNQLEIIRAEKSINAIFEEKKANLENEQDQKAFSEAKQKYLKVEGDYAKEIVAEKALQAEYDKNELEYQEAIKKGDEKEKNRLFKKGNEILKQLGTQEKVTIQKGAERDYVLKTLQDLGKVTDEELAALATVEERKKAQEDLNKALDENLRRVKNINRAQGLTGTLVKGLGGSLEKLGFGDLGLSQVQEDMKQMAVDLTENGDKVASFGDRFKIMGKGLVEIGKNLLANLKDPLVVVGLLVKGFKSLIELGQKAAKETAVIGQNFINFGAQSAQVAQNLREIAASDFSLNTKEATDAMISLNKEFGTAVDFSNDPKLITTFKEISHDLGIGAENTAKLFKLSQLSKTPFENITAEIKGTVTELNNAYGTSVNITDVINGMANVSAKVRANLQSNPKAIAEAVFQAKRLGFSLNEIQSSAESTLDFESSIQSQLTAQLMLNKSIDLTAYRRAALSGDAAAQAEELNRLIAQYGDDLKGNTLKQKQFAGMLGISVDRLMEGIEAQSLQDELGKKGIKDRVAGEKAIQAIMKKTGKTRQEAFAAYSKQEIEAVIEKNKAAELMERSIETMKEIVVTKLAPIAEQLVTKLSKFVNSDAFTNLTNLIGKIIEFIANNPMTTLIAGLGVAFSPFIASMVTVAGAIGGFTKAIIAKTFGTTATTTATSTAAMGAGGATAAGAKPSFLKRAGSFMKGKRGRAGLIMGGIALGAYGLSQAFGGSDEETQNTLPQPSPQFPTLPPSPTGVSDIVSQLLDRIALGIDNLNVTTSKILSKLGTSTTQALNITLKVITTPSPSISTSASPAPNVNVSSPSISTSASPAPNVNVSSPTPQYSPTLASYREAALVGDASKQQQFAGMLGISTDRLVEKLETQKSQTTQTTLPSSGSNMAGIGAMVLGGTALTAGLAGSSIANTLPKLGSSVAPTVTQSVGKTLTGAAAQASAQAGNATVTRAIMQNGTKLYGAAAQSAVNAGTATATRATMNATAQAGAQAGGGFFSNALSGIKNFGQALKTPGKSFAKFLKNNSKAILKNFAKWGPISALLEGIFLVPTIQDILANPDITKKEKDFEIGKESIKAITGVGGGALAAALAQTANVIPGLGLLLGSVAYTGGDWVGKKLGEFLADLGPETTSNFGSFISKTFFHTAQVQGENNRRTKLMEEFMAQSNTSTDDAPLSYEEQKANLPPLLNQSSLDDFISRPGEPIRKFNKGDIIIGGTNLLPDNNVNNNTTTSSPTVDNSKIEQLLERLINVVEKEGNVYLDAKKVGTALGMSSYRT